MVNNITAERLAEEIGADEQFTLIDVRPEESFEAWHVRDAENVPYDPDKGLSEDRLNEVDALVDDRPVVAICGKGLTSTPFAFELDERGYDDVSVVTGGMEAWSKLYETVPIETADDDLVVRQVQRRAKGCLGYVVGSKEAAEAVVVDATRQTDRFKIAAQDAGLSVGRVLDTHVHADHVSGGSTLADEVGVAYHLGDAASERGVEYEYDPLSDGDVIEVGDVEIEALHTPGHTSEMLNYLVDGDLLLTGDTLFVDSVGRTELQFGEDDASRGAELLYDSLHETILELPDDTTVLPGHLAVTSDGRYENGSPGEPLAARLGDLRDELDFLGLDRDAFVERLTEDTPEKPANYERVIAINTGKDTVDDEKEATELELGPNNCAA
ncbi:Glyoxylase, beta-lactamase superfamily II [Halorubrum xinjiangense]|uniref:Glyoxylase, beta-lactamase superfamily II n=1 Tax=Halorubrum xinjiangense TaxID=261291 RepID=A0A1G7N0P7_9EURY|nr:rhodanese-like domain-containing protein [Halorubrum xinjiangense]SDF67665.1 Glyoxylase, beta-lactamase superfamily II [Halorubrum xinjiangense]